MKSDKEDWFTPEERANALAELEEEHEAAKAKGVGRITHVYPWPKPTLLKLIPFDAQTLRNRNLAQ